MAKPYESEHERFMSEWLKNHPDERLVQRTGRELWWEAPRRTTAPILAARAYAYDDNFQGPPAIES